MNKKKKSYLSDYEIRDVNGKEKAVYCGDVYKLDVDGSVAKKLKVCFAALALIETGLFIGAGLNNGSATRNLLAILPFIVSFLPLMFTLSGTKLLIDGKAEYTRKEHDRLTSRMLFSLGAMVLLGLISAISAITIVIKEGRADSGSALFAACVALYAAVAGAFFYSHKRFLRFSKTQLSKN